MWKFETAKVFDRCDVHYSTEYSHKRGNLIEVKYTISNDDHSGYVVVELYIGHQLMEKATVRCSLARNTAKRMYARALKKRISSDLIVYKSKKRTIVKNIKDGSEISLTPSAIKKLAATLEDNK